MVSPSPVNGKSGHHRPCVKVRRGSAELSARSAWAGASIQTLLGRGWSDKAVAKRLRDDVFSGGGTIGSRWRLPSLPLTRSRIAAPVLPARQHRKRRHTRSGSAIDRRRETLKHCDATHGLQIVVSSSAACARYEPTRCTTSLYLKIIRCT
jgi:hypothetical protein